MNILNIDTLFKKLFKDAENLFGERLKDWEFSGIEVVDSPPFIKYYHEEGRLAISLSSRVIENDFELVAQLSHEIRHLLYPSIEFPSLLKNSTLIINEGISTYFTVIKMKELFNAEDVTIDALRNNSLNYFNAYILVRQLIEIDNYSIKKLRAIKPRINKLQLEDFESAKISISESLKKSLLNKFIWYKLKELQTPLRLFAIAQ